MKILGKKKKKITFTVMKKIERVRGREGKERSNRVFK
jgi:hypothetical protein